MENNNIFDGSEFYNLDYTHDQLEELLDKLNEGFLLTKEQHEKLINEIGLDNISTFDLDYNKLNNLPPEVPVRVSYFINDKDYIVRNEVKEYLLEMKSYVEDEIDRLNSLWESLRVLDIELLLEDVITAQNKVDNFHNMMETYNGTLLSMSRMVDSIDARTEDVINDLLELERKQEADESLINLLHETVDRHIREIQNLVDFVSNEKIKLENVIIKLNKLIELADYLNNDNVFFHNEVNAMKSEIPNMIEKVVKEEFERISIEDLDIEGIIRLSKDVKDLGTKYESIYNSLNESVNNINLQFDAVNKEIGDLETLVKRALDICADMGLSIEIIQGKLDTHDNNFITVNETFREHNDAIQTNLGHIRSLDNRYSHINSRTEIIENDIINLRKTDAEHYVLIKQIEKDVNNTNNSLEDLDSLIDNNTNKIDNIINTALVEMVQSIESMNKLIQDKMPLIESTINNIDTINKTVIAIQNNANTLHTKLQTLEQIVEENKEEQDSSWENATQEINSLKSNLSSIEAVLLTLQSRVIDIENTFATKELINNIELQMHINKDGSVIIDLTLEGEIISSITIPYDTKFEDEDLIARTDSARTDYHKTI